MWFIVIPRICILLCLNKIVLWGEDRVHLEGFWDIGIVVRNRNLKREKFSVSYSKDVKLTLCNVPDLACRASHRPDPDLEAAGHVAVVAGPVTAALGPVVGQAALGTGLLLA